tara:strand:- start:292 stop:801 length:510 start_codon:yes stop_codon:yes gene_type:complete
LVHVSASLSQSFTNSFKVGTAVGCGAVESNGGSYVAGHYHVGHHVRGVKAKVNVESFSKAFDCKFRGAVCGVGDVGTDSRPKSVDAARIYDVSFFASNHERKKCSASVVHAVPAHIESFFPRHSVLVGYETSATSDTGIVEQQIDMFNFMSSLDLITKREHVCFVCYVT